MKHFEKHLAKGLLKKQTPSFAQIEKQLRRAAKDLLTAEHVSDKDPQWAATIAYHSMLRAGRALLFCAAAAVVWAGHLGATVTFGPDYLPF